MVRRPYAAETSTVIPLPETTPIHLPNPNPENVDALDSVPMDFPPIKLLLRREEPEKLNPIVRSNPSRNIQD